MPAVVAAIIAGITSAVGAAIALVGAKWQLRGKMLELDLKKAELDKVGARLEADAEALRQTLMRDVLEKRMAAYAALWRVMLTYERNWLLEQKALDAEWAGHFLVALNGCNAEHGVFFSESVYKPFFEYRQRLVALLAQAKAGVISKADLTPMMEISTTGIPGTMKALGAAMKDDLGSYLRIAIQAGRVGPG
jgi:hypothetical protein